MAATTHAKLSRRKLDKLNIHKICDEILYPSVPMALRLSGILMGGVVIVYERKVKLLYDDVTRLLEEMNEAWKVKVDRDPTILPKGKSQAKKEAVTLPDNEETDLGDIEQSLNFSSAIGSMRFQQIPYSAMRLDNVDESFLHKNPGDEDPSQNFHQADIDDITLHEPYDGYRATIDLDDRLERFDKDTEALLNFTLGEHTQMPTTLIPSPPAQDEPQRADENQDQHLENPIIQQSAECNEHRQVELDQPLPAWMKQGQQNRGQLKRKTRRPVASLIMDYEQTIISGQLYQSWLQNASDITKTGRKRKETTHLLSKKKIVDLIEMPLFVLTDYLFAKRNREIHYPAPLLELSRNNTQISHGSLCENNSPPQPPDPSLSSPPERVQHQESSGFPFEDIHSGVGSQSLNVSIEKLLENTVKNDQRTENLMEGDDLQSILSSAWGHGNSEMNSGRSDKKRPCSSSRHGGNDLEPVVEEISGRDSDPNLKFSRLSENGLALDPELLVETVPTQVEHAMTNPPLDKITDSIQRQMKMHFDTPGARRVESLNSLVVGMDRKGAAMLFYQTCVLATRDCLRVVQKEPYGDIFLSKGPKM